MKLKPQKQESIESQLCDLAGLTFRKTTRHNFRTRIWTHLDKQLNENFTDKLWYYITDCFDFEQF